MQSDLFQHLTPQERDDLALCGISSQEQLSRTSSAQLIKDLEQARQYFPDRNFSLTREQIASLFAESEQNSNQNNNSGEISSSRSSSPTTGYKRRTKPAPADEKQNPKFILHSPVRCTHPFLALFAAFCTLFLLIPLASIVIFPVLMITDRMPDLPIEILAILVFGVPCLVYMFIARKATCPVCHMRIFRYNHYTRNHAAHHLPILGYNFATALHILLLWKYNCPGCGTPVKLIGSKGRRTHR